MSPITLQRHRRRKRIWKQCNGRCHYCGKFLELMEGVRSYGGNKMTIDHIVPKCKGGGKLTNNFVASCHDCNKAKGKKDYNEFEGSRWY